MAILRISLAVLFVAGCAAIAPISSPGLNTLVPTAVPGSAAPTTSAPATTALESPAVTLPAPEQPTSTPEPTRTPKPTRRPTPSPTPIAIDISIFVQTSDIPNPWYTDTPYTIPVYVAVAVADVPSAHAKVSIPEEAFATSFDTGAIATTDNYFHNVDFNLTAMGPATLTLTVKAPAGYVDVNRGNNKVTISINVLPKP